MKKLFIDVETGGVELSDKVPVLQIAGIFEVDGNLQDEFNFFIAPDQDQYVSPGALEITGKTMDEILERPTAIEVFRDFTDRIKGYVNQYDKKDKMQFIAYNEPFDNFFIRSFFRRNNDNFFGSFFWNPGICIMRMAHDYVGEGRPNLENFKLQTVAEYMGLSDDNTDWHNAKTDIEISRLMYHKIKG